MKEKIKLEERGWTNKRGGKGKWDLQNGQDEREERTSKMRTGKNGRKEGTNKGID